MKTSLKKIIFTGGSGRFGKVLSQKNKFKIFYPNKKELNILSQRSIIKYIKKTKPDYFIHAAGLSRPMSIHDKNKKKYNLNIIGTSNVVIACEKFKLKLIYFSTGYVYPGKKVIIKKTIQLIHSINMLGPN